MKKIICYTFLLLSVVAFSLSMYAVFAIEKEISGWSLVIIGIVCAGISGFLALAEFSEEIKKMEGKD